MDPQLMRVLLADNPWLRGEPLVPWLEQRLPADYRPRHLRLHPGRKVLLVVGPRQVGKSTLIWKTLAELGEPALFVNCEEPSVRAWLSSPASFLAELEELAPGVPTLFFEEIQFLDEAGLFLKGLVDRQPWRGGRRIVATGSSSFDLQARTRESLAGRAERHLLLPFSVAEIAAGIDLPPALAEVELEERIEEMVRFGSYPAVVTAADPRRELAGLVEAFVVRDVSDRFRIRNVAAFRKVLELAASQAGSLCNLSEWASVAGINASTVDDYCQLMEESHVLRRLSPYAGGKRAEITSTPKVYFLDNGVRNQLFGGFQALADRADRGALFESFVFTEISKQLNPLLDSIRFWRSKSGAEIDFVIERRGRLVACEVKAGDARGNVSRGARSFIEAYAPEVLLVVNRRRHPDRRVGETPVRFLRLVDFHRALREALGVEE